MVQGKGSRGVERTVLDLVVQSVVIIVPNWRPLPAYPNPYYPTSCSRCPPLTPLVGSASTTPSCGGTGAQTHARYAAAATGAAASGAVVATAGAAAAGARIDAAPAVLWSGARTAGRH